MLTYLIVRIKGFEFLKLITTGIPNNWGGSKTEGDKSTARGVKSTKRYLYLESKQEHKIELPHYAPPARTTSKYEELEHKCPTGPAPH